jgi:tetraacyldisaccharide 4'-kinase
MWWLAWAAAPYRVLARLHMCGYAGGWFRRRTLPVPVISVGNLTVGGTGKTPMVIHIAEWLRREGKRVAVLSRGYGRTAETPMLLVSDGVRMFAGPEEAGDEPYLIAARCPEAVVAVGADRYKLGRWVLNQSSVDCILLDDGFQHVGLHRDVDLLLIDATDVSGLDQVLPAGRLREPLEAARRATAVVITRAGQQADVDQVLRRLRTVLDPLPLTAQTVFQPTELLSITTGDGLSLEWCRGKTALLVSAVGHAASFRGTAEALGLKVLEEAAYPDHHRYTRDEVARIRQRAVDLNVQLVLTTEKDAGKLRPYLTEPDRLWWAVRLTVVWTSGEAGLRQSIMEKLSRAHEGICA